MPAPLDIVFEMRERAYVLLAERSQDHRRRELVETAQIHDEIEFAQNERTAVVRCEGVANANSDVGAKRGTPGSRCGEADRIPSPRRASRPVRRPGRWC